LDGADFGADSQNPRCGKDSAQRIIEREITAQASFASRTAAREDALRRAEAAACSAIPAKTNRPLPQPYDSGKGS